MHARSRRLVLVASCLAAAVSLVAPAASATTIAAWQPARAKLPANALAHEPFAGLYSVDCPTTGCVAVGVYEANDSSYPGLIDTNTSAVAGPVPSGESPTGLETVACTPSGGECIASPGSGDFVDVRSGSTWSAASVTMPTGVTGMYVAGVACWNDGCVGVANLSGDATSIGVIEDSGGTWTAVPVSVKYRVGNADQPGLAAVSCRLNGACEAVGNFVFHPGPGPEDIPSFPVIMTGSVSSGWTAAQTTLPAGAEGYRYEHTYPSDWLTDVSCPHSGPCVAVGQYIAGGNVKQGLIMSNGTPVQSPVPASGSFAYPAAGPQRVSCAPTASGCTVVGEYLDTAGSTQLFTIAGSGTSWAVTAAPLPLPSGAATTSQQAGSDAISCGSASLCAVAGSYVDTAQNVHSVLLNGAGSSWTATQAPAPGTGTDASVSDVSCTASRCRAVGTFETAGGYGAPLWETLAG